MFATTFTLACLGGFAQAHEYKAGALTITHPWLRAVPGSKVGAGYLTITNTGSTPDRLTGGTLTGAARLEVHASSNEGGVARMRPVESGLEIKPHQTVTLAPGGYHLMLMDLSGSFVDGELVPGTLQFENAGPVPVEFEAQPVGTQPPASHSRTH
jgi:copper(I)-binding protein